MSRPGALETSRRQVVGGLAGGAVLASVSGAAAAPAKPAAPWTGEGFVRRPGGRLHYLSMGEGPPLVLLHKLGGWAAEWRAMAPLLAGDRRVIAFDMPGHGESAMDAPAPYILTLGESAAMIHAALQDMGIERFDLVGASLGGCVGTALAADYPQAVSRLALISVALFTASSRADMVKADEQVRSQYGPGWQPLPRTEEQVKEFASIDPRVNAETNLSRAKAGAWVRASERGVGVAGVDQILTRIVAPTLLVYADRGRYTPYEAVGRARLKTVEVATIKDTGSFTYQEKPAETAAALRAFLRA